MNGCETWRSRLDHLYPETQAQRPALQKLSERRLGVRWKEADGRVFESDESGMVYAVDSRGERIVDPTFRRRRRPTNEPPDE
jgi:hypothetical protein